MKCAWINMGPISLVYVAKVVSVSVFEVREYILVAGAMPTTNGGDEGGRV
jgi:hypothetical protein